MGCFGVVGVEEVVGCAELAKGHRVHWPVSVRDSVTFVTAPSSCASWSCVRRASRSGSTIGPAASMPWLCPFVCAEGCFGVVGGEEVVGCAELAKVH